MAKLKFFFILIIGDFIKHVMLYNPMLTYTLRFKKAIVQPSIYGNLTIDQYKETQFINGNITVPSTFSITSVVGLFYRCDSDGINCEYFQTWKMTDLCSKMKEKNQVWSRWYGSFHPPLVCPFNKVHYQIRNGTFDIGLAILLYPQVTDYQWRIIQKFYDNDTHLSNMVLELSFFGYRKKIKTVQKP
ncbi:uncharacterized protein LOC132942205 [Metopolophium dirhodum]|uniref:uncharacterized protein LOC132942205 n=1 Tax=Metopolophium dirhodum TaxID=44670 RepID=UPI0029904F9E|nr:uncharacterized protein LOC132942205 [Metopolophium dirhodum]